MRVWIDEHEKCSWNRDTKSLNKYFLSHVLHPFRNIKHLLMCKLNVNCVRMDTFVDRVFYLGHTFVYLCMCVCVYACMRACVNACICVRLCICTCLCMCVHPGAYALLFIICIPSIHQGAPPCPCCWHYFLLPVESLSLAIHLHSRPTPAASAAYAATSSVIRMVQVP